MVAYQMLKLEPDALQNYPLYLLNLSGTIQVVFPEGKEDIGHMDYWENVVSHLVAKHFHIPQAKLANLPYCQRRARVVGDRSLYGGKADPTLLNQIRQAVGQDNLVFVYDDHEKRLKAEVLEFRKLVRRYRPK
jgi:hypothetical protein